MLTLSGAAQPLPAFIGGSGLVRWLSLQPGAANANPVFLGGAGVSTTVYGTRLPAAAAGVPPPPHIVAEFEDGALGADDFYVIGTLNDTLHVHALAYV